MGISICMIVKNEELNIDECLKSVKNYVSEIIVVDTGSSDKTKNIALKYTDKVYDFKWCNDFSKARNYSISKASNEIVMILDADEIIIDFQEESINKIVENPLCVGRIERINVFHDEMGTKKYIERVNRVFNKNYFKYEGKIHEQVVKKDGKDYNTINVDVTLNHIGYMQETIKATNKIERNLMMLKESIQENPNDPYLRYQLGKTYYMAKNYEQAYESFKQALELNVDTKYEYVQDLIETYGYTLIKIGREKEALGLEIVYEEYKNSVDYIFLMALIYMNNAQFIKSIQHFKKCIGSKKGKIEGINSYLAYYNIGVIYECLGEKEKAKKYYKQAIGYVPAMKRIEMLNGVR